MIMQIEVALIRVSVRLKIVWKVKFVKLLTALKVMKKTIGSKPCVFCSPHANLPVMLRF